MRPGDTQRPGRSRRGKVALGGPLFASGAGLAGRLRRGPVIGLGGGELGGSDLEWDPLRCRELPAPRNDDFQRGDVVAGGVRPDGGGMVQDPLSMVAQPCLNPTFFSTLLPSSSGASSWMSSSDRGRSRPLVKSSSTTVDPGGNPPSSRISGTLIVSRPQGWILPWISTS